MNKMKYTAPTAEAVKIDAQTILAGSELSRGNSNDSSDTPSPDDNKTYWAE